MVEVSKLDSYSVSKGAPVKYIRMGTITKILSLSHKNNKCPIRKINKDEYIYLDTGELLKCKHIKNRSSR